MNPTQTSSPYARPLAGTFRRSAVVGALVITLDVLLLGVLVEDFGVTAARANLPALGLGLLAMFFGNKYFAFRDHSDRVASQGFAFLLVAAAAVASNAALFHLIGPVAGASWPVARAVASTLTYFGLVYRFCGQIFHATDDARRIIRA
jgi:putative flippase GtrA